MKVILMVGFSGILGAGQVKDRNMSYFKYLVAF